jgi:hypothetical protein
MAVKIFRSVWFLSVLVMLAVLLYHYAGWPEEVVIGQAQVNFVALSRDAFFYSTLAIITFINTSVFIAKYYAAKAPEFLAWYYGFIAIINFFLMIGLSFIGLFNSNENFRFGQIGFIIYGSLFLIGAWLLGGLLYWVVSKNRVSSSR